MEIKINNNNYKIYMLPPESVELKMEDGEYHSGVTDFRKKEIYIADDLNLDAARYTIIHEVTHAVIDSYGFIQVDGNDEIVADFVGNYYLNIAEILQKIQEMQEKRKK